jgi:hypothetical protein
MIMRAIVAAILFISMATSAEESATAYLMTTSVSSTGNVSLLHIINTSSEVQNFTGTMYQGDGAQLGGSKVKLNTEPVQPNSRIVLSSPDLETLFSVGPWIGPSMIEVSGSSAFKVMIKLESPSGFVSNTNCVTSGAVHNIDGFDSTDDTFIRFINTGTSPISDIRGNLYNAAGENVGSSDVQLVSKLDPKEQIWINRDQLSQKFGATWTSEASLTVQAVDELKLLNLNFIDGRTFFNFSCFESSQNSQSAKVTFPEGAFGDSPMISGDSCSHYQFFTPDEADLTFSSNGDSVTIFENSFWDGICEYEGQRNKSTGVLSGTMRCAEGFDEGTWSSNAIEMTNGIVGAYTMSGSMDISLTNRPCDYSLRFTGARF